MILNKEVEVMPSGKMIIYYKNLNYVVKCRHLLLIKIEDLPKESHIKVDVKCDICGLEKKLHYYNYVINTKEFTEPYCCNNKCSIIKNKKTNYERYNDENYNNREKFKSTSLSKFGAENYTQTDEYKEKSKQTNLKRYGVEWALQSDVVKQKIRNTNIENIGFEYPMQCEKIREKSKLSVLEKYGVDHISKSKEIKTKVKNTNLERYGVEYPTQNREIFNKAQSSSFQTHLYKNSNLSYQGSHEKYFLELMESKGFLNMVFVGKSYNYYYNEKIHTYYSDYTFNNVVIEIKSYWTYNRNGSDKELESINETKWQTFRDSGDLIIILKSKHEIKNYVDSL